MRISRTWAMPTHTTFRCKPIGEFVNRWIVRGGIGADSFARNCRLAKYTNDLNPKTEAKYHMDATDFLNMLTEKGIKLDYFIFDPPYSPGQIKECYQGIGREVHLEDTQNGRLYKSVRDAADKIIKPGGICMSFGWNSAGMGKGRGYEIEEILLVAHGGAHNDTICMAESKTTVVQDDLLSAKEDIPSDRVWR